MKALLQRVTRARVSVAGTEVAAIGPGLVVLLGIAPDDTADQVARLAAKTLSLRIFPDDAKPMNRSVVDIGGEVLVVSQFTLTADTRRGNRPSFTSAARPDQAERLYGQFVEEIDRRLGRVASGRFGADMQVELVNDGPVTFLLE